jgi:hypothetical protein
MNKSYNIDYIIHNILYKFKLLFNLNYNNLFDDKNLYYNLLILSLLIIIYCFWLIYKFVYINKYVPSIINIILPNHKLIQYKIYNKQKNNYIPGNGIARINQPY